MNSLVIKHGFATSDTVYLLLGFLWVFFLIFIFNNKVDDMNALIKK